MALSDEERRSQARVEVAAQLSKILPFAIGTGLTSEAVLIAKLIEAVLSNTTNALILKLK